MKKKVKGNLFFWSSLFFGLLVFIFASPFLKDFIDLIAPSFSDKYIAIILYASPVLLIGLFVYFMIMER